MTVSASPETILIESCSDAGLGVHTKWAVVYPIVSVSSAGSIMVPLPWTTEH